MIEKIGNVSLNLTFYKGQDLYSDGEIEDELLEIVKKNNEFTTTIQQSNKWPILYHLSKRRENLINWYPFVENAEVLEIGAGCGAITTALCEKVKNVIGIELSKKRSEINAYRNKNRTNLEILVGNFNDIKIDQEFDYITLIGVLEYAKSYTNTNEPYVDFLKKIKKYLKPQGKLIIAIENKFGLKYWAGCREDHTGKFFDGLENYMDNGGVRTFSRKELTGLLNDSGFNSLEYYYPLPDYKLPTQIFSDSYKPGIGDIGNISFSYDQDRVSLFDESLVYDNIIQNGDFETFANSFLVICEE
jgi:2-polyprenyl-3-methyl-5-hydroxy-6-metoxy-1,4-benzoquinol methylase